VVVDGSNIATEGRSMPSLAQLNEAVMSFMEEYPGVAVTVVVDATFGHRIDKKEAKDFEEAIANNELVAPPAGAVGRGDAFVLGIAQKANATILSNDSFQEFHGQYGWLFDEGRLIGGKPVPHVGWVFVERTPVRGAVSRQATGAKRGGRGKKDGRAARPTSEEANQPMPVPKTPPPGRARTPLEDVAAIAVSAAPAAPPPTSGRGAKAAPKAGEIVNELMPFLEFVEHHPIGTSVNGTVESYSSHGAYVAIGEFGVRGYVPLRLMGDPAPTSARKIMKLGESVTLVVVSFAPQRRSIDCALPDMASAALAESAVDEEAVSAKRPRGRKGAPADSATLPAEDEAIAEVTSSTPTPTRAARKAPAPKQSSARKQAATPKVPAAKRAASNRASDAPARATTPTAAPKKAATKKAATKKAAANTAPVAGAPAAETAAAAKKAAAKKAAAKKAPAKEDPAPKKAAAKKAAAPEKSAPKKAATKRTAAAKKAPATRAPAAKAPAAKAAPKQATVAPAEPAVRTAPAKRGTARGGEG
jgi:hypothetical protein